MKELIIEIPDEAYELTEKLALARQLSPQQLLTVSLAQYLAQYVKDPYLEELASRGRAQTKDGLKAFLDSAPDVEPDSYDKL